MRFVETSVFTRLVDELLNDDEYHALQLTMLLRPKLGSVIRGCGGLRKMRWSPADQGKRGGLRLIYY